MALNLPWCWHAFGPWTEIETGRLFRPQGCEKILTGYFIRQTRVCAGCGLKQVRDAVTRTT